MQHKILLCHSRECKHCNCSHKICFYMYMHMYKACQTITTPDYHQPPCHSATMPPCQTTTSHHARLPPATTPQHHHARLPPATTPDYRQPPRQTTASHHARLPPATTPQSQTTTNHHTTGPQTVQRTSTYTILSATHRNTLLVGGDQVSGGNCSGGIVCALHIKCELHRALGTKVWTLTILQEQHRAMNQLHA